MFNDFVFIFLLLLGLAIVGFGILVLIDFLRGKKPRLQPETKETLLKRQNPKSRTVMAIFYLVFAVFFLLGNFFDPHKTPFWERPVAVVAVVCGFILFVISMIDLYKVVRGKRVHAKS